MRLSYVFILEIDEYDMRKIKEDTEKPDPKDAVRHQLFGWQGPGDSQIIMLKGE